ncbi:hypothetical protein PviCFBP13515_24120 [Pseudomonas viridiflava]|nr:hypothetical protein PviCFBP13515_24120 [Pseudomonas viridiflava]
MQDNNTYKVDEKSLGPGISQCVTPFCDGMSTISGVSGNFGATNIDSNYASVTEQSGISLTECSSIRWLQRPSGRRRDSDHGVACISARLIQNAQPFSSLARMTFPKLVRRYL